ncbi:TRAP transporter substrate-binding protein [Alkalihalobacterium elongatum]|uniref:TRAP transporter substrate-binding protein n=1 Tax=Alkalihalobacterium elongatum TaxID=2675466 RepID=UPI001C1F86C4|nr:TRAP transporter substrate-binding protein [Alkalihalobacterium elongatum]
MKRTYLVVCLFLVILLTACGNSNSSVNLGNLSEEAQNSNNEMTSPTSSDEETFVLKVAHGFPTASFMHTFMEWFDEEIQKRSDGRLSLEIFPSGQLMPIDQEVAAVLQGQIDIVHSTSPILAGFDPIWNFYELPFIFAYDPKDPSVFLENRIKFNSSENGGQKIVKMMEAKGLKVLSLDFIDMFGSIYTNDESKLVTGPESVKGLKLRTPGGLIGTETVKALGASSMTIAGTEVITALQQGVVDGLLTVPIYAHDAKLPIKSFSVAPLFNSVTPVIMSLEKFESLPKDLQEILVETGKDLELYAKEQVQERAKTAYINLENEGVKIHYPTKEEIRQWEEATKPAREVFEAQVEGGKELLEELANLN